MWLIANLIHCVLLDAHVEKTKAISATMEIIVLQKEFFKSPLLRIPNIGDTRGEYGMYMALISSVLKSPDGEE